MDDELARAKQAMYNITLYVPSILALGNQINVIERLMTTKFPLNVILMELVCQLQKRQYHLDLQWIPRLQNIEADALTNGDFEGFCPLERRHDC